MTVTELPEGDRKVVYVDAAAMRRGEPGYVVFHKGQRLAATNVSGDVIMVQSARPLVSQGPQCWVETDSAIVLEDASVMGVASLETLQAVKGAPGGDPVWFVEIVCCDALGRATDSATGASAGFLSVIADRTDDRPVFDTSVSLRDGRLTVGMYIDTGTMSDAVGIASAWCGDTPDGVTAWVISTCEKAHR